MAARRSRLHGRAGPTVDRAVYVISVAADLAGVHPQTLRIYERKGLLRPKRTSGNTRRYSERDVEVLRRIQRLTQDEGVNLAGVRIIMEMEGRLQQMQAQLERAMRQAAEMERQIHTGRGVLARLSDVSDVFEEIATAALRGARPSEGGPRRTG